MSSLWHFHFLRPWWLLLLIPALLLLWWRRNYRGASPWRSVIDEHLQPFVLVGSTIYKRSTWDYLSLPLFLALLSLALSGPTTEKIPDESQLLRKPLTVIIEMSEHMSPHDISPSRYKRAIYKLKDLLAHESGREVSLIAFAGDAHVVVPLTNDHKTFINMLESLSPELMPKSGANLLSALKEATTLEPRQSDADILVLTSTNVTGGAPNTLEEFAEKNNLHIYFWAFATSTGAPLLSKGGQFSRDQKGITISSLNSTWLENIQKKKLLSAFLFTPDNRDIQAIEAAMARHDRVKKGEKRESYDSWYDLGPYILALAMVVFLLSVWKKNGSWWLFMLIIAMPPKDAQAEGLFNRLFKRADQRAHEALFNNNPSKAADLYKDDFSKGTALYKAKRYQEAREHLAHVKTSDGYYNLGNTYAQLGNIDQAINAYGEALKLDPDHKDARFNKELLEKEKKEQEQKSDQKDQESQNETQEKEPEESQKDKEEKEKQEEKEKKEEKKEEKEQGQENKKQEEKGAEKKEQKSEAKKEEPKEQQEKKEAPAPKPENKRSLDQNELRRLEQLQEHNDHFLKRKFLYESRTRKRQSND